MCDSCSPLACPSHCVASCLSFPSEHLHTGCRDQKNWPQGVVLTQGSPPTPTPVPQVHIHPITNHKPQLPWAVSKH